jgi:hypothetical protein
MAKVDHDVALMALELHPELLASAEAVQLSRTQQLSFPVETLDHLVGALEKAGGSVTYGGRDITADEVRKFVPEKFFPIESERDLLSRLLIAFLIGRQSHHAADRVPDLVFCSSPDQTGEKEKG